MKYQVIIIGGGPAGYTAAETAGKAGLSVVLFEKTSVPLPFMLNCAVRLCRESILSIVPNGNCCDFIFAV